MKSRVEDAIEYFRKGFNCSQAVACAYGDLVGLDSELLLPLMEGYGRGLGSLEGVCGAISGAVAISNMWQSKQADSDSVRRAKAYGASRMLVQLFQKQNGTIICKELKGIDTDVVRRKCEACVRDAAEMLEEVLLSTAEDINIACAEALHFNAYCCAETV